MGPDLHGLDRIEDLDFRLLILFNDLPLFQSPSRPTELSSFLELDFPYRSGLEWSDGERKGGRTIPGETDFGGPLVSGVQSENPVLRAVTSHLLPDSV